MMSISQNRRGSALLVVLGMLAFMLFSGLAFSVYMRQSRLPTSFLRRATTTRQLAKAALAEAIEDLDKAIGNDPHPGLRTAGKSFDANAIDNFWSHRVFVGRGSTTNPEKNTSGNGQNNSGNYYPALVSASETVPVLTLEGLAYLPPNLINEARYYSQRTPTAKWHSFWFDSGRYAYTAIDVSDYFDVNRMFADKPRAACGTRCITLAHLFEDLEEGDETMLHVRAGQGAAEWDNDFMKKFRSVDEDDGITFTGGQCSCPLISLADFNMAWGRQELEFGGDKALKNPFYSFVENGNPYNCGTRDKSADKYSSMTFVTDSWLPSTASSGEYTLEDARYQPFNPDKLQDDSVHPSPMEIGFQLAHSPSEAKQKWLMVEDGARIPVPAAVALWDYLDVDSIPISLCMPTVERTPMVCGIKMPVMSNVKLNVTGGDGEGADQEVSRGSIDGSTWGYCTKTYTYKLDISDLPQVLKAQGLLTYPFQEHGVSKSLGRAFKVDGRISVFLTNAQGGDVPLRPGSSEFKAYPAKDTIKKAEVTDRALVSFPIREKTVTPENIIKADSAYPCYKVDLDVDPELPEGGSPVIAKLKYTWPRYRYKEDPKDPPDDVNPTPDMGKPIVAGNLKIEGAGDFESAVTLYPLESNGKRMTTSALVDVLQNTQDSLKLKANVAIWIRVRDAEGHVVDYVPAWQQDDINYIERRSSDMIAREIGGDTCPLMRVVSVQGEGDGLVYSCKAFESEKTLGSFSMPETKLVVSDPRYNYAPENWVRISEASGELDPEDWKNVAKPHAQAEDGDVFMSTSDVGYMQSIYELAFLPRMSNGLNSEFRQDFNQNHNTYGMMPKRSDLTDFAAQVKEARDYDCMWRTYSPFPDRNDLVDLEAMFTVGRGLRVNPYSDSTKVLMAAFANTPHDWRTAATNDANENVTGLFEMDAKTFNGEHAWNVYSTDKTGRICWDCLEELAGNFKDAVRESREDTEKGYEIWESAFANLGWDDKDAEHKRLGPVAVDDDDANIYSVDKKFFYGFWHDCFAARQQLFLVFVRAEPMMMGGGVMGQTPPQLGARAVALVWRDPTPTRQSSQNNGSTGSANSFVPHRTRILFYHQFD